MLFAQSNHFVINTYFMYSRGIFHCHDNLINGKYHRVDYHTFDISVFNSTMDTLYFRLSFTIILFITREIKCNANKITLRYEEKNVDFNITIFHRKVFSNTAVWSVVSDSNKNLNFNYEGTVELNGVMYEDLAKKAILLKEKNCSDNCWEAVFGLGTKRQVIKRNQKISIDDDVFGRSSRIYKSIPIRASAVHNNYNSSLKKKRIQSGNRDEKFYAKLLIVVDHALFKKLQYDIEYVKKYMSIFWSAVDLQYRNISSPHIEIRITGILIGKNDNALDYVIKNSPDGSTVNIKDLLYDSAAIKNVIIKNTNLTNFDAIVTMTGFNGFIEDYNNVKIGSNGISWNGSICIDEYNFSAITDDGAYYGVHNAIHEIGHLFGLDHDGAPGNGFFCYLRDYRSLPVMYRSYEVRELEFWSTCSLTAFEIFTSNDEQSWCLKSEYRKQRLSI